MDMVNPKHDAIRGTERFTRLHLDANSANAITYWIAEHI